MSEEDIKLGEDLAYKRAGFAMDQFVKLNEVRGIVHDALHTLLDKF